MKNNNSIEIKYGEENKITDKWFHGKPLKVITHGWRGTPLSMVFNVRTAYLETGDYNIISVDWHRISSNLIYFISASAVTEVGKSIAKLLKNFVSLGMTRPSDIHLIGHSLGAHVMGACGNAFENPEKIGRITGLDPALPGFEFIPWIKRHLNASHAQFVDVIHTSAGTYGYLKSLGSVDFYPNNGKFFQPGCLKIKYALMKTIKCSHFRSIHFYIESVYNNKSFIATKCTSWYNYKNGICKNNEKSPMGDGVDLNARGDYYLRTNAYSPYAIKDD